MDAQVPESSAPDYETLNDQVRVLRAELKNIREKQKQLQLCSSKFVTDIKERICSGQHMSTKTHVAPQAAHSGIPCDERFYFKPISYINSCYLNKNGTPRQANLCVVSKATLKIGRQIFSNPEHSIAGLQEFSHVWLIFVFHQNADSTSAPSAVKAKVRAPRMDGGTTGVFATRSPHRPCPIGLSLCKLDKIEDDTLYLSGVDLVNGTPILDIKPYIPSYDSPFHQSQVDNSSCVSVQVHNSVTVEPKGNADDKPQEVRVASWLLTPKVSTLCVLFTERAEQQLTLFHHGSFHKERCAFCLDFIKCTSELRGAIEDILREDPRSVYRRHKCTDRLYYFTVDKVHVTCWFDEYEPTVEVLRVQPESDSTTKTL